MRRELHLTLKQANYDLNKHQFNTVASACMKILNALERASGAAKRDQAQDRAGAAVHLGSGEVTVDGIDLVEGYDAGQLALQPDLFVIGNVVTGRQLVELPLNGRNFTQPGLLQPGKRLARPVAGREGHDLPVFGRPLASDFRQLAKPVAGMLLNYSQCVAPGDGRMLAGIADQYDT